MPNWNGNIGHHETEAIKNLFVGKKVTKAEGHELTLSDGTVLQIIPNEGGCSCGAGDYYLDNINKFDSVITDVEVKVFGGESGSWEEDSHTYQIFVYSGGISTSVADIKGDDGNGYYGTGFDIHVKYAPGPKPKEFVNIFDKTNWEEEQK